MKVYYSDSSIDKNARGFHVLINNIALYLKKYFNAELVEKITNHELNFSGIPVVITDCDMLIHKEDEDRFYGISFSDFHNSLMKFFILRNNSNDVVVISQNSNTPIYFNRYNFAAKHSIYTESDPHLNLDEYYIKRKYLTEFIDQFIFRGNWIAGARHAVGLLKDEPLFFGGEHIPHYFDTLIKYKVGLSLPGIGELCYRDIEYMAVGIPMMRFEYIAKLNPQLIPNYHYISIDRIDLPEDLNYNGGYVARERNAEPRHAEAYVKKFKEVKDDKSFLDYISNNARKYYESYLHPITRVDHIVKILQL